MFFVDPDENENAPVKEAFQSGDKSLPVSFGRPSSDAGVRLSAALPLCQRVSFTASPHNPPSASPGKFAL